MNTFEIPKIAEQILPKDFDSHLGISCTSFSSNIGYSYLYNRGLSNFQLEINKNPSIKFVNNHIDKFLELKLDIPSKTDNVHTTIIYNPFFLGNFTLINEVRNMFEFKRFSVPVIKFETDNINGISIYIKNKIRPFVEQSNPKILKINVENSYSIASNIIFSNIHFIFPLARFSLLTNVKQSIFSMKLDKNFCLSFVFNNNHYVSSISEIYFEDSLKRIFSSFYKKCKLLNNLSFSKDKLGFKYDSGNNYYLLRHENCIKINKLGTFESGSSLVYRANTFKTACALKYTTKNNDKVSFSIGKTEDMKMSAKISVPFKDIALLTTGVCIGPIFTKYPSKNFCFNINFYD